MNRINKRFFLIPLALAGPAAGNPLDQALAAASGQAAVTAPTATQLQQAKSLFAGLLAGAAVNHWQEARLQAGPLQDFVVVRELPEARQGRGLFAVRANAAKNLLLQAPHADTDLYTGKIVSRLFLEGGVKAGQWNTVKRDSIDLAHADRSYWQQFTLAFAERYRDGKIVQVHGFEQTARKTRAGAGADMIVSAGSQTPPAWVYQAAACLKTAFPDRVGLYPKDLKELGGTTNAQGRLLQKLGHAGFLHIEMSKPLRQQLRDDADARRRLLACL